MGWVGVCVGWVARRPGRPGRPGTVFSWASSDLGSPRMPAVARKSTHPTEAARCTPTRPVVHFRHGAITLLVQHVYGAPLGRSVRRVTQETCGWGFPKPQTKVPCVLVGVVAWLGRLTPHPPALEWRHSLTAAFPRRRDGCEEPIRCRLHGRCCPRRLHARLPILILVSCFTRCVCRRMRGMMEHYVFCFCDMAVASWVHFHSHGVVVRFVR